MRYISLGDINKKLLFILAGGLSKLIAELILYFYAKDIKMNDHPFILGINANLGMILAFIPDIILKCSIKKKILKDEKSQNRNYLIIEEKKAKRLKVLKALIIALCCILDFLQKILTFLYSQYIINNLWLFDIVFLGSFSYLILGLKLYSHQYLSSLIMIILGIVINAIQVEYNIELIYKLLLSFMIGIFYNLGLVIAKYGMDSLFMTPYEITYYEGIFGIVVNIIFLSISTNIELINPPLIIELAKSCKYKDKTYLDNFYGYWESFHGIEILLFIVEMFSRALFNLFGHIIAKDFTPSHVILLLMLGEVLLSFKTEFTTIKIISLIIILFEIFMLLIFTEIIELNFCGLEYNTKKNIREREQNAIYFDSKTDDSGDIGEGLQIKENDGYRNNSFTQSSSLLLPDD